MLITKLPTEMETSLAYKLSLSMSNEEAYAFLLASKYKVIIRGIEYTCNGRTVQNIVRGIETMKFHIPVMPVAKKAKKAQVAEGALDVWYIVK